MPYRVVMGCFRLTYEDAAGVSRGSQRDGDSVRFEPAEPSHLTKLGKDNLSARFNKGAARSSGWRGSTRSRRTSSLSGFDAWLREEGTNRDDALFIRETAELGNLHDVIEVKAGRIRMVRRPEGGMVVS
jgi:hypothetical protein